MTAVKITLLSDHYHIIWWMMQMNVLVEVSRDSDFVLGRVAPLRTSVHNGSVQHCCNLCKSIKLDIIKTIFFSKTLILIPLADVQLQCSVPESHSSFSVNRGKNQEPSPCQTINDIYPHRRKLCQKVLYKYAFCLKMLYSILLQCAQITCNSKLLPLGQKFKEIISHKICIQSHLSASTYGS